MLNISNSPLQVSLPAAFGISSVLPNLTTLQLQNSSITGAIPASWTQPNAFPMLQQLFLQNNALSGTLPSNWSAALPAITWLQLSNNPLTGSLPMQWADAGQFLQLAQLTLDDTNISGTLPVAWGRSTALPELVYVSCMGCVGLTGTLPASWGGVGVMSRLQFIGVRNSGISGAPPDSWATPGAFPSLRLMDLSLTALSGSIPPSWGSADAFPSLTAIYINQSRMSGAMPAFNNANLSIIIADSCNLSGDLDPFWNSTAPLTAALMANNSISGFLPQNESAMPQLKYLDLNNNPLQGTLPLPWLQPGKVVSHVNQINLGSVWKQSEENVDWKQGLCLRKDIFDSNLAREHLGQITGVISNLVPTESYADQLDSQWGNVFWMFQSFSSQLLSVTTICANSNAPTVLLAMWLAFAAILIANYLLYEGFRLRRRRNGVFQPFWERWWTRFSWVRFKATVAYVFEAVAPLIELTIYYYDLLAAVIVLKNVWHTWPGYVLLGIFLFHFALTGGIVVFHSMTVFLDNWRFAPHPNRRFAWHFVAAVILGPLMIPVVLCLDTIALAREILIACIKLTAIPSCSKPKADKVRAYFKGHTCAKLRITWIELEGYEDMHNLIAGVFQTIPTVCLNSVIFALGNKPSHGLFFSQSLFVSCMIAAYVAMLKTFILVLWAAYYHGQHVFLYAENVMTGNFILKTPSPADAHQTLTASDRTSSTAKLVQQQQPFSDAPPLPAMSREPSVDSSAFHIS